MGNNQFECRPIYPNRQYGLWTTQFKDDDLKFLWNEINAIQDANFKRNENPTERHNQIGHLEHEYLLTDETKDQLDKLLAPLVKVQLEQNQAWNYRYAMCDKDLPIKLQRTWVNFQQKYEYNPIHHHTGIFSFVLWLKIPYNREDEANCPHTPKENLNGNFHTFFLDQFGVISEIFIPLDSSYENTCLIFPCESKHCVYPFYTSDEYRISVSGNFAYQTP